jgi:ribonuclease HI
MISNKIRGTRRVPKKSQKEAKKQHKCVRSTRASVTNEPIKTIFFTDGSFSNWKETSCGGGIVVTVGSKVLQILKLKYLHGKDNEFAEIYTIAVLVTLAHPSTAFTISTDYKYDVTAMKEGCWKNTFKYDALYRYIADVISEKLLKIEWNWVKGHSGIRGNKLADKAAGQGRISGEITNIDDLIRYTCTKKLQQI